MPHPLSSLARRWAAACGAAALVALPLPALSQDAAAPSTTDTTTADAAPAPEQCSPGVFGEFASLSASEAETDAVTAVHLEFQCGDILSDGTFIPTGYRVELEGECDGAACDYPLAFLVPTASEGRYEGMFVSNDGADVILRLRRNRQGAILAMIVQTPGSGEKAERTRVQLSQN